MQAGEAISHYRILAQIGAGGMGVVYRAYDQQLEREVALKVLPSDSFTDEDARRRFRKEALALARLNHPNIATIFEFGSDKGVDFLVTEYIRGITLDTKLASGPLELSEILDLGIQLSRGLAAAHEQGLVHRDLKPGNLRVMPNGHLKILDFGLAQLAPRPSADGETVTLTRRQEVAGTLPYMSPEQLRGGAIDGRSDLWSAGAVLHELATGKRPFKESSAPVLINAIMHDAPVQPSKTNPKLPPGLDQVVLKALQKDVTRRYQTATELRLDLERISAGQRPAIKSERRFAPILVGALVLVMAIAGFFLVRRYRVVTKAPGTRRAIAVLGFKNLAGNKEQSWLSTALSEMLATELSAGAQVRTIPGETVSRARSDLQLADVDSLAPDTLTKVNKILGADLVVLGSYLDLDGQIRVDVRVQDASAGDMVARFSDTGTEAQLFDLVRRLGEVLCDKCGAGKVTPQQAVSIRASQPASSDAVKLYSQGLTALRSYDTIPARDLLLAAVANDPYYALAHRALADAWSQLGYDEKAKNESKRAFELSSGLPRPEASVIEARYREENREWQKAIEIYRSLWTVFPDDPEYALLLARAQVSAGQGQAALETVARLRKFPPPLRDDPRIDLVEATAARSLSDYRRDAEASEAAIRKATQTGSQGLHAEGLLEQCWALRNIGEPERATSAGRQAGDLSAQSGDFRAQARSLTCVADVLADQGEYAAAQQMHEQALELARKIGAQKDLAGALINLGNVFAYQQKIDESSRQYKLALALALSIGDRSDALLAQGNLGANLSMEGDYSGAQKFFNDSFHTAEEIGDQAGMVDALINRGSISFLQGGLQDAAQDLEQADRRARQLQLKSRLAAALTVRGDLSLAMDDLPQARKYYDESQRLHTELGEKGGVAATQISLALLDLEEQQPVQAESLARSAATEFRNEKDSDQQTAAEDALVQSLIAQKHFDSAGKQLDFARKLGTRDLPTALSLEITGARLGGQMGKQSEAQQSLQEAEARATQKGLFALQQRSRLAMAEIQIQSGKIAAARATLSALKKQVAPRGFRLLARKATILETSLARGR